MSVPRFVAAVAVIVVAIIVVPFAMVPVWNSADAIVIAAPIVFAWLAWPRDTPPRPRPVSRALDEEYSRIDVELDAKYHGPRVYVPPPDPPAPVPYGGIGNPANPSNR